MQEETYTEKNFENHLDYVNQFYAKLFKDTKKDLKNTLNELKEVKNKEKKELQLSNRLSKINNMLKNFNEKGLILEAKRDKIVQNIFARFKIKLDYIKNKIKKLREKMINLPNKTAEYVGMENFENQKIIDKYLKEKNDAKAVAKEFIDFKKLEYETEYNNILQQQKDII